MKRTSMVSVRRVVGFTLLVVLAAGAFVIWRASQALRSAAVDVRAANEIRFGVRPFAAAANSEFQVMSAPAVFFQAARFQDHLYVAGPAGLLEYDPSGALLHQYAVGRDLPGSPLIALSPAVLADSQEPELILATANDGLVDLTSAIAYSCNSYFRLLTKNLVSTDLSQIVTRFGLQPPPPGTDGSALAGFGGAWRISPFQMAHAYLELIRHQDEPGVRPILSGMAQSARQGTAAGVDRALAHSDALAKTGTAPCTHSKHAPGDGFTVVLIPADLPQFLLLVRVHGAPGAEAAKTAGEMLHRLEP